VTFKKPTGLAWRLFGVGLAQLALLVLAALGVSLLAARYWTRWDMPAVVEHVEPFLNRPTELSRHLTEMRAAGGPEVSVYDDARQLLASNVEPALLLPDWSKGPPAPKGRPKGPPPTSVEQLARLLWGRDPRPQRHHPEMFGWLGTDGHEGAIVVRRIESGPGAWPLLLTLFSGFLVVGVGAVLTARLTVRPLRRLASAASKFGGGDLSARTELTRSDEIGDVARAFDDMAGRIQALVRVEKELMANVAHELRTPLSRIRVALEIAAEGDAETARASLSEIAVDLTELEQLVNDVLTTTSLELSGDRSARTGLPLNLSSVSARQIAEDAAQRFRARFPARTLTTRFEPELPMLEADATLLRRALDNLLENAHKYSPNAAQTVSFSAAQVGARASFQIDDCGVGIDAADLERVFRPFFRAERSRTRSAGGVGLGLTLARQIVEAHGGTLELASTLGEGTTASVVLPAV
jgi:two-component system, OmpR family, sensor kinase